MIGPAGPEATALLAALDAAARDASAWGEAAFAALLAMPGAFALANEAGFVLVRVAADEAEIIMLAVRPEHRRAGHGRALLHAAMATAGARGAMKLFLEVAEDNAAARALYAACGFAPLGRRANYYGSVAALLMGLTLSSAA
jgi:ribosomal-protein-alanine N-acetyltransferase